MSMLSATAIQVSMISMNILLCFLLFLSWVEGICEKYGCTAERNGTTVYFGLMLSYPDHLERKGFASVFDDGHDIAPAAYLAVEQINSRSDLLSDYHVELLPLDGGCDVIERTVVGINNLACICKPIIGIAGPSCGTSAELVGEFTSRDQFSMVTIHYGEWNRLGNRDRFPFAFGILGANWISVQAFTHLILRNNWTRVVLLYPSTAGDPTEISAGIEQNIANVSGYTVAFTSPIYDFFIPLQAIRQSFVRVIILLSSAKATLRTLCLAFHEGMIFPKYQWVFKERFENDFVETSFRYEGKYYNCTEEDISASIHGSINLAWSLKTDNDSLEYEEGYSRQRDRYRNKYNVSSMPVEWARGIYDAVQSLAFALNGSLDELNVNLTEVLPGSKELAQTIANHMPDIDFQGVSGRIDFDNETGFNTARRINIYQFGAAKSSTLIGFYASKELVIFNDTTPQFIKATFDEKRVQVNVAVAITFLVIRVIFLLLIVPIHIINTIYHNHSAIRATSPKLNHLIFIGFYLTVVGMMLHTITETWPHTLNNINNIMLSNMCKTLPWFLNVGSTLVLGTVCAKTWRLYYIYSLAKRGICVSSKRMADPALIGYVGAFASIDVLLCLLWTCIDPLRYSVTILPESKALPMVTVTGSCQSTQRLLWSSILLLYKCVLILCSSFPALLTKLGQRKFQTNNILILSYILAVAFGLGMPIYAIIYTIDVNVTLRFIVRCFFVDTIIYICLFALFLPSVVSFATSFQPCKLMNNHIE